MGMPSFQLCVDHKPLLAIFGKTELGNIHNPRLFNQKEKNLMFKHTPVLIPRKLNVIPDCWSRRSDSPISSLPPSQAPSQLDISNILPAYQDSLGAPSWVAPPPGGVRPVQVAILLGENVPVGTSDQDSSMDISLGLLTGSGAASLAGLTADVWHNTALLSDTDVEVITWEKLSKVAMASSTYRSLHSLISSGAPKDKTMWPDDTKIYYHHRHTLVPVGAVLLLHAPLCCYHRQPGLSVI